MKIRLGFVSNSSSSSYTCSVCGSTESGMDMNLRDAEMVECVNGHDVCVNHLSQADLPIEAKRKALMTDQYLSVESRNEIRLMSDEEVEERFEDEGIYHYPEEYCPICQFKAIEKGDILAYLMKEYNLTDDAILETLKTKFKTYGEFLDSLKK